MKRARGVEREDEELLSARTHVEGMQRSEIGVSDEAQKLRRWQDFDRTTGACRTEKA